MSETELMHCLRPWGAGVSLAKRVGGTYEERMRFYCRIPGTRMDFLLGLIERGIPAEEFRAAYAEEAERRGWGEMDAQEAAAVYWVAHQILRGTLSKGMMGRAVEAQRRLVYVMADEGKRISHKRAQRIVKVVRMRGVNGWHYDEIAKELEISISSAARDFEDFTRGKIEAVHSSHKLVPFDEWLEKHGEGDLTCLRRKRKKRDAQA